MKNLFSGVCICTLLAVAGFQYREAARLRAQNAALAATAAESDQIRKDLSAAGTAADPGPEIERLRAENVELLRLRSEVGQLRKKAGLAAGSPARAAEPANATVPLAGPMSIPREQLSNAGFQSPESAVQTLFWSFCHGDMEALSTCFVPEAQTDVDKLRETFGSEHQMARQNATVSAVNILASRELASDKVEFVVQVQDDDPAHVPHKVDLVARRVGSEWKLEFPQH